MKRLLVFTMALALTFGMASCVSIPCAAPQDKPTCEVNYYISIADQIDANLQAIAASIPLGTSVAHAIAAFHSALPGAEQSARDALAAYESTHAGDYTTAVKFLIALYGDINNVIIAAGQPDQVAKAKATIAAQPVSGLQNVSVLK
jgi:hypothetical protein